jgi:hypothetical protein
MKKILFIFVLFLAGCANTQPAKSIEYIDKPIYVRLNQALLTPCELKSTPPDKQEYLNSDLSKKEFLLVNYANSLMSDFGACARKVKTIIEEDESKAKIFKDK